MADEPLENENQSTGIVIDQVKTRFSDFWKLEDYWAIWLGFALLVVGLIIYIPNPPSDMKEKISKANSVMAQEAAKAPFKTIEWHKASDLKDKVKGTNLGFSKKIKKILSTPHGWKNNPVDAFVMGKDKAAAKAQKASDTYDKARLKNNMALQAALKAQDGAARANFKNTGLNDITKEKINEWRATRYKASKLNKKTRVQSFNQLPCLVALCIFLAIFFAIGTAFMEMSPIKFIKGFIFIFSIATIAYLLANQVTMKSFGIGYAAWAILIGLIISNTIRTPKWVMPAVQTEYYIKTGLVLLGAEILFSKIISIGIPGIFVAWVVTPVVLVTTYILGQKVIKMPSKTLNIVISADMSVCGVSAAIATASACRAKKEELTLAVGLSLIFTSIMMILMPIVIKATGMPYILGGAWMGGTIDATGAVAAAGAFLSERALYVAATIKMIQNVLIGLTAFCVALYWCAKVDCIPGQKVKLIEIWIRFPKFVIGFILASIIFSLLYVYMGNDIGYALVDNGVIRGFTKNFRGWFFCLAFVSIGLATDFRQLAHYFKGGKPFILYVCGQSLNLCLTLLMAYIMFYLVFPDITANI